MVRATGIITSVHIEKWAGYVLTDKGNKYEWRFDGTRDCCEDFEVEMDCYSIEQEDLIGSKIKSINIETFKESYPILNYEPPYNDPTVHYYYGAVILQLQFGKYIVNYYNGHNGYYCHNLDIIVNGKIKMNVAL